MPRAVANVVIGRRSDGSPRLKSRALLAGLMLSRLQTLLGGRRDPPSEQELLVGDGLTLALLIPRCYFAGARLLAFMDRAGRVVGAAGRRPCAR